MSALSDLSEHLRHYRQLPYHHDTHLAHLLQKVQSWQRARIHRSHHALFSQPKNQAMSHYFIDQLYGGEAFATLATQLERIVPKAQKLEKIAPSAALVTGSMGIHSAIAAIELDLHLAQWLAAHQLDVNESTMLAAYRGVNEQAERREQIDNLKEVCYRTDKYLNSFMLQKAFTLAKSTAYKYHYNPLYDFIADGFAAMKPLKSVRDFIEPFCELEYAIIEHVHDPNNRDNPSTGQRASIDPFVV